MMKIKYNGEITPCNIKAYGVTMYGWNRGEVRDLSDHIGEKILKNKDFSLVSGEPQKEENVKDILDLDGDGDFDKDDLSIAGKAMARGRSLKKEDKMKENKGDDEE